MKFIIGKKIEMSQRLDNEGNVIPVTLVQVGPCLVSQIKTKDKAGYSAVQVCYGEKKSANKQQIGHLKNFKSFFKFGPKIFREFNDDDKNYQVGQLITVDVFQLNDIVTVVGNSKGRGYAGVVKRHHFHGHPKTHGHKDQERHSGSVGVNGVQHTFKGTRMAGRMGNQSVTVKNLKIIDMDKEKRLLYINGSIPGSRNSIVFIKGNGAMKLGEYKINESVKNESTGKEEKKDK